MSFNLSVYDVATKNVQKNFPDATRAERQGYTQNVIASHGNAAIVTAAVTTLAYALFSMIGPVVFGMVLAGAYVVYSDANRAVTRLAETGRVAPLHTAFGWTIWFPRVDVASAPAQRSEPAAVSP